MKKTKKDRVKNSKGIDHNLVKSLSGCSLLVQWKGNKPAFLIACNTDIQEKAIVQLIESIKETLKEKGLQTEDGRQNRAD